MDIFDTSDYDFLLSKRTRKRIALALVIGIAFVPSVKSWYLGQIERHAEHITQDVQDRLTPDVLEPPREQTLDRTPRH
ncbi:MAG: hypothetical protein ACTHKG_11975 [Nocardioides sp.]